MTGPDELLTRGTAWAALWLYAAGEIHRSLQGGSATSGAVRWWSTLGCGTFLMHIVCAFQFYHGWSHAAAYADTARQTAALLGRNWNWGGGLYVNYLFALVWLGEMTWSWCRPGGYVKRPRWLTHGVRGFFLFMIVNGTVVFVQGPMRWVGLCLCLVLLVSWSRRDR